MTWDLDRQIKISVIQGDVRVSDDPNAVMSTLVGSCVSACLYDTKAAVGGMNHFLLPEDPNGGDTTLLYGINQMELLVNQLLKAGASKHRLKAKLFGGNQMSDGFQQIGNENARLAERFLADETIPLMASALRGTCGQRIQFHPATGRVRTKYVSNTPLPEIRPAPKPVIPTAGGDVEFF